MFELEATKKDVQKSIDKIMLAKLKDWQKNINTNISYGNGQKKKVKKDK